MAASPQPPGGSSRPEKLSHLPLIGLGTAARLLHGGPEQVDDRIAPLKVSGTFKQPELPRCALIGMPRHLELWKQDVVELKQRLRDQEFAHHDFHGCGGDVDGLRAILAHKYANAARGWRIAFAPDELGVQPVKFNQFCMGCRRIGYSGNARALWRALSAKTSGISICLEDLEPRVSANLDEIAKGIVDLFEGGAVSAWEELVHEHALRSDFDEFEQFIHEQEVLQPGDMTQKDMRGVFDVLDIEGRGTITCEDLCFLDHWAARRLGVPLPPRAERPPAERERWSPPPPRKPREPGLEDFREHLVRKFGSMTRAWRVALDVKGCGTLRPSEFGVACRALGWLHPHEQIWQELRDAGDGMVKLRALDPETAQAFDTANENIILKFGDIYTFWTEILDRDGSGTVSRTEFIREACDALELDRDVAKRIFAALDTADTGWIAFTEVGFLEAFDGGRPSRESTKPAESSSQGSSAVRWWDQLMAPASISQESRGNIWDPSRSSRSIQHRAAANSHAMKHRWLRQAVLERSHGSTHSLHSSLSRSLTGNLTRPKSDTDIFRETNEFYREGVRLLKAKREAVRRKAEQ